MANCVACVGIKEFMNLPSMSWFRANGYENPVHYKMTLEADPKKTIAMPAHNSTQFEMHTVCMSHRV